MLPREEYVEQQHFFREFRRRLKQNVPTQEILDQLKEEALATTNLPMAIDFLRTEVIHSGRLSDAAARIPHYFTPFQTFLLASSEEDRTKFDQRVALAMMERLAKYMAKKPKTAGVFIYQFECVARNRLGYDHALRAIEADPIFDENWKTFIATVRRNVGTVEFSDMIYARSQRFLDDRARRSGEEPAKQEPLFDRDEGRIAYANRGKDPLYMFAALQRQLGYPRVPRPTIKPSTPVFHPALEERLQRIEKRMKLIEAEQREELDLSKFYKPPPEGG
ncbi:hypothetical protein [Stratiformator vulcanicus]|uniref:Uncharacterized protein n=1 Tax=Stratiformator vulcanicus TaxID=2527980 RepID=A0A517R1P7_9PLAN|nr:hypothetical protein [Stratiformator vulcanicus]QDT37763.1 hypothetical protein Pan189_21450 [Stratiformator vulcanicus]